MQVVYDSEIRALSLSFGIVLQSLPNITFFKSSYVWEYYVNVHCAVLDVYLVHSVAVYVRLYWNGYIFILIQKLILNLLFSFGPFNL